MAATLSGMWVGLFVAALLVPPFAHAAGLISVGLMAAIVCGALLLAFWDAGALS